MRDWEKYLHAKKMRDAGYVYKKIGESLGVSMERARQLCKFMSSEQGKCELQRRLSTGNNLPHDSPPS